MTGPGGFSSTPLLLAVSPDPLLVSVGDVIKIIGINFDKDLSRNQVNFTSGAQRIPGVPIRIDFPSDGNKSNGLESELQVVVPGGVATGNVELRINGFEAGSRGFDARPQIMAWTLGRNETQPYLQYLSLVGFSQEASFVKLFGLNFSEIEAVEFRDSQGGSATIAPNGIERNPLSPIGSSSGTEATGYSVIGFSLKDNRNDVRLNFIAGRRENMKIRVKSAAGFSNTVEVPVHSDDSVSRLSAVINGVKVPTGVRTGQVRIHYSLYDLLGGANVGVEWNYRMEVLWKLRTEEASLFRVAKNATDDPMQSGLNNAGLTGILPGSILTRSPHRLLPGGGAVRTFTWDAPNDPALKRLMEARVDGAYPGRYLPVEFLLRPTFEKNNLPPPRNLDTNHEVVTPAVLYNYLQDRPGDVVGDQLTGGFIETFENDLNEDPRNTTADFGLPNNPGALVGRITGAPNTYGEGTESVRLLSTPTEDLLPDVKQQYYLINTDDLSITYRQITLGGFTPCNLDDDEVAGGGLGQRVVVFENPGEGLGEFHLATLEIGPGVEVFVRGLRPLVVRLGGLKDMPEEEVLVCGKGSRIDMNGCAGEDGPRPGPAIDAPGNGGRGGPGGGNGGLGASFIDTPTATLLEHAERGGRDGGEGGETTLAVDAADLSAKDSKSPGGPGGGGGNRTPGQPGDSGPPVPPRFAPAKAGRGGPPRGEPHLLQLSPGSGGGGGGGTLGVTAGSGGFNAGAGGGGGGGALRIVANGSVKLDPSAVIEAMGGGGGNGVIPKPSPPVAGSASPSPGGGGSGGCILIQARGSVELACESLRVQGGLGGTSAANQNKVPGSGSGGEGWIRVESASGGVPTCSLLTAETNLAEPANATHNVLRVVSSAKFPSKGTVQILAADTGNLLEEMSYLLKTPTTLGGLTRVKRGDLPLDARVVLKGGVAPLNPSVLSGGGVLRSPDNVDVGRGRDGEVHVRFEVSIDSVTGQPIVDPVTGEAVSIWGFDTDAGILTRPSGDVHLEVSASDTDPGRLECSRFVVDPHTTLLVEGTRAFQIFVTGQADIGGTIDVSGGPGGVLQFVPSRENDPGAGLAGRGGPGGGAGGAGGVVQFVNGDLGDKSPENTLPIHAGAGLAPVPTPQGWDQSSNILNAEGDPDDQFTPPVSFVRATGGLTLRGQNCGGTGQVVCIQSSGGGGGGGNIIPGLDGSAFPVTGEVFGVGGSIFGLPEFRFDGEFLLLGGTGGGGGGGNPHISGAYQKGYLSPLSFHYRNSAEHAPGTGGGGGGGVVRFSVQNLNLRSTCRILARGGDAFQSIDFGGNGGGGAGGNILIQVRNSLTIEQGVLLDVTGGIANREVPILQGQTLPEYPGNERPGTSEPVSGGLGGNGAPGRIRIEADLNSLAAIGGVNFSYSAGPFLEDTVFSIAVSKLIRLGVGLGSVAATNEIQLGETLVRFFEFGQPNGTDLAVTWQGALESLDVHGGAARFSSLTGAAGLLGSNSPGALADHEFVRFIIPILSNGTTRETQAVREISLPYSLPR